MKQGVRTAVKIVCIMAVVVSGETFLIREYLLQLFLDVKEALVYHEAPFVYE